MLGKQSEGGMKHNRKPPKKFESIFALISELNNAGHPRDKIWYGGKVTNGQQSETHPIVFIAADSRMIGQRHTDGTWWTLYGYDDVNDPAMPEPGSYFKLEDYWFQLSLIFT